MNNKGYLTLVAAIFTSLMLVGALAFTDYVINIRKPAELVRHDLNARLIAEAGLEKAVWMLNNDPGYTGETATGFGSGQFTVSVAAVNSNTKRVTSTGYIPTAANPRVQKKVVATAAIGNTLVAFKYAIQTGEGGFTMGNNSTINGNVYSNGRISGGNGAQINGDAVSSGAGGKIEDLTVAGAAKAHTIEDCTVNGDAYYVVRQSCGVGGTAYPNSPDPEPGEMPVGNEEITGWQNQALVGGTYVGNLTLNSNQSLGPRKIQGNLVLGNNIILTLTGTLWITGTVSVGNGSRIQLHASYGSSSEVVMADGAISIGNSAVFTPAGAGSYIMMLSLATSSAISIGNTANAVILCAPNGWINVGNNISLKEVTAYGITLGNGSVLNYESGLASKSFSGGPGAAWEYQKGSYFSE